MIAIALAAAALGAPSLVPNHGSASVVVKTLPTLTAERLVQFRPDAQAIAIEADELGCYVVLDDGRSPFLPADDLLCDLDPEQALLAVQNVQEALRTYVPSDPYDTRHVADTPEFNDWLADLPDIEQPEPWVFDMLGSVARYADLGRTDDASWRLTAANAAMQDFYWAAGPGSTTEFDHSHEGGKTFWGIGMCGGRFWFAVDEDDGCTTYYSMDPRKADLRKEGERDHTHHDGKTDDEVMNDLCHPSNSCVPVIVWFRPPPVYYALHVGEMAQMQDLIDARASGDLNDQQFQIAANARLADAVMSTGAAGAQVTAVWLP